MNANPGDRITLTIGGQTYNLIVQRYDYHSSHSEVDFPRLTLECVVIPQGFSGAPLVDRPQENEAEELLNPEQVSVARVPAGWRMLYRSEEQRLEEHIDSGAAFRNQDTKWLYAGRWQDMDCGTSTYQSEWTYIVNWLKPVLCVTVEPTPSPVVPRRNMITD